LEVRVSRASAAIVQRVPKAAADWFLEWQRGITAAAEGFPGYRDTDVYPPADGERDEWVVVLHFDDDAALQRWLTSPERAGWVKKLRAECSTFDVQALPGGFGPWFARAAHAQQAAPPSWKMVVSVVLGLFPTVMLLSIFVGPYTEPLGFAVAMLIGNALSVSILQWAVMPVLTAVLARWLGANAPSQRALSYGGLAVILGVLACLALLFRQVTG
jgi:antibiotic biosynthesis monooxygenase (ABM) superfamily enzyme